VPHALLDELHVVGVIAEDVRIGHELHQGAVLLPRRVAFLLLFEYAALEYGLEILAFAVRYDAEAARQRVHRLGAYAVQAHGKLEYVVVVLCSRVDDGHAVDDLAQGYAPAPVAYGDSAVAYGYAYALAVAHDVFVDGVIHHFFKQYIDAVVGIGA
jgi:hypothetical protein